MATGTKSLPLLARFHREVSRSGVCVALLRSLDRVLPTSVFQLYRAILLRHDLFEPLMPTGRNKEFVYRLGTANDIDQLEDLAGHTGRPSRWFQRGDHFLIVADEGGTVIGYENFSVSGHDMRDAPITVVPHQRQLFAVQIVVRPSHRGRMIAHDIAHAAHAWIRKAGYRSVYGLVLVTNDPARSAHFGRGCAPVHDVFCLRVCGFTYLRWGSSRRFAFTGLQGRLIQRLPKDPSDAG